MFSKKKKFVVITDLWKLNGNCGKWKLNEHYLPYICYTHETSSQNFQLSKLSSLQILPHNDTNTHSRSNQLTKTKTFIYTTDQSSHHTPDFEKYITLGQKHKHKHKHKHTLILKKGWSPTVSTTDPKRIIITKSQCCPEIRDCVEENRIAATVST